MRFSNPIILYLPDLLVNELDKYLKKYPPNYKYQRIYFYYIVHHLTCMQIRHKKDEFYHLNRKHLKSVTVSNIDRYIKTLKNGEFIISDNTFTPGVKSLKYKINPKFIGDVKKIELSKDSKLSKSILKKLNNEKAHYNRLEPHLKVMCDEFRKVELDYKSAIEWVQINAKGKQLLSYLTALNNIEDKRFRYFKRNNTNKRLDTNFTNLKKDLKQFIKGDYVSIDLKNSQPFLLGILIDNIINTKDTLCCYLKKNNLIKAFGVKRIKQVSLIHQNQEKVEMVNFRSYFNSVLEGSLYNDFIKCYGNIERDEVKNIMFKVMFSRNEYYKGYNKVVPYEKDKEVFSSVFPFVYEALKILKEKDNKVLPIYLQRLESYLFIDCIAKELVKNGIIPFTIHDSVIVKVCHHSKTLEIMNDVFKKQLGIKPSLDIKKLKIRDYDKRNI